MVHKQPKKIQVHNFWGNGEVVLITGYTRKRNFPGGTSEKSTSSAGDPRDVGSIPRLETSPKVGNGNPLQYSYLENFMGRGAWQATVPGVTKSQT